KAIHEAAATHFPVLLQKTRDSNSESRRVLEERNIEFLTIDDTMVKVLRQKSDQTMEELVPEKISQAIHKKTLKLLDDYRNNTAAEKAN
ncbi:MAG: hypothetical protein ACN4GW_13425, partial [Desulforhopalus sp.]